MKKTKKSAFFTPILANWSIFCQLTGLHGFAYTVTGRNLLETLFWNVAVAVSVTWASVNCYNSFFSLDESPVTVAVETLKYDAKEVPYPTITFCPEQHLDELNLPAILLNRVKFRCKGKRN